MHLTHAHTPQQFFQFLLSGRSVAASFALAGADSATRAGPASATATTAAAAAAPLSVTAPDLPALQAASAGTSAAGASSRASASGSSSSGSSGSDGAASGAGNGVGGGHGFVLLPLNGDHEHTLFSPVPPSERLLDGVQVRRRCEVACGCGGVGVLA
jgi:hypothetical protein